LRAAKLAASGKGELAGLYTEIFAQEAVEVAGSAGRAILANCSEGDALRTNLAILKRFTKNEPPDAIGGRRRIASRLTAAGKYVV
jgi:butyryl-CoA dehydrogenase